MHFVKILKGRKNDSGQGLVEFALVASLFIFFLFAIVDFGYLFYAEVTLQDAVRTAARYAITGNCQSGNCYDNQNQNNRLDTIIQTVQTYSFNLTPVAVTVHCSGTCGTTYGNGTNNAGGPGDTIQISASYVFHPVIIGRFFTGGSYTVTCSSSYKNEQFQPAGS